jgi:hypothetical protein
VWYKKSCCFKGRASFPVLLFRIQCSVRTYGCPVVISASSNTQANVQRLRQNNRAKEAGWRYPWVAVTLWHSVALPQFSSALYRRTELYCILEERVGRESEEFMLDLSSNPFIPRIRCCFMETTSETWLCQSSSEAGQWQITLCALKTSFICPAVRVDTLCLSHWPFPHPRRVRFYYAFFIWSLCK